LLVLLITAPLINLFFNASYKSPSLLIGDPIFIGSSQLPSLSLRAKNTSYLPNPMWPSDEKYNVSLSVCIKGDLSLYSVFIGSPKFLATSHEPSGSLLLEYISIPLLSSL
jgi:hypothetical protein